MRSTSWPGALPAVPASPAEELRRGLRTSSRRVNRLEGFAGMEFFSAGSERDANSVIVSLNSRRSLRVVETLAFLGTPREPRNMAMESADDEAEGSEANRGASR